MALDCPRESLRSWAVARERVAARDFGSPTRCSLPANSRFAKFTTRVQRRISSVADGEPFEPLLICERAYLGDDRALARLAVRTVVRANVDGADHFVLRIGPKPGQDPSRIEVTDFVNCAPGAHRTVPDVGVRALNLDFDHPLRSGDTYTLEFTVDFTAARIPDALMPTTVDVLRGFRRSGPLYLLEAVFPPTGRPADVRQIHLSHPDADEDVLSEPAVTQWNSVHIVVSKPAAGLHGIRWRWREPTMGER